MRNGFERLLRARRQLLRRRRNSLCRAGDIRHDLAQTVLHRVCTVCEHTDLILAGFVQISEAEIALCDPPQSLGELLNGLQRSANRYVGKCAQDENDEDGGDDCDHEELMTHTIHHVRANADEDHANRLTACIPQRHVRPQIVDAVDRHETAVFLIPFDDNIGDLCTRLRADIAFAVRLLEVRRDTDILRKEGDIALTDLAEFVGDLLIVAETVITLIELAVLQRPVPRIANIHVVEDQLDIRHRLCLQGRVKAAVGTLPSDQRHADADQHHAQVKK